VLINANGKYGHRLYWGYIHVNDAQGGVGGTSNDEIGICVMTPKEAELLINVMEYIDLRVYESRSRSIQSERNSCLLSPMAARGGCVSGISDSPPDDVEFSC
jgi:hypothetical protein